MPIHGGINIFIGWVRCFFQQGRRRHDLSTLAVAALWDLFGDPGDLYGMLIARRQSFNSRNVLAGDLRYRNGTRPDGGAVNVHSACAAQPRAATELGAGELQGVTQDPKKRRFGCDAGLAVAAVHAQGKVSHVGLESGWRNEPW